MKRVRKISILLMSIVMAIAMTVNRKARGPSLIGGLFIIPHLLRRENALQTAYIYLLCRLAG